MAKVRVYELAKELGLESKELLSKLQEVGEFVRSASSTVEAPVVRKLMDKFPDLVPAEAAPKAKKAPAKKAAPKQTVKVEDLPPELQQMIEDATPVVRPTTPAAPRSTNNPFSATPAAPPRGAPRARFRRRAARHRAPAVLRHRRRARDPARVRGLCGRAERAALWQCARPLLGAGSGAGGWPRVERAEAPAERQYGL